MSITKTQNSLLTQLVKAYPQQFKSTNTGPILVQVDDQESDDGYPGFCHIHLKLSDPNSCEFILTLSNVPVDDDVKELAAELDGIWDSTRFGERLTLTLSVSQCTAISNLATAIRNVVGKGRHYDDPNWKWIARRTAKSLERLARTLAMPK
jgi:hypothetical protein